MSGYTASASCLPNPALDLELPCQPRPTAPRTLTPEQITTLLEPPETDDPWLIRDHAILELFYSTGMRLAELAAINHGDLNADSDRYLIRHQGGAGRPVFIGSKARTALARWRSVRGHLPGSANEAALFSTKRVAVSATAVSPNMSKPTPPLACRG